jgi:hypothetical protein
MISFLDLCRGIARTRIVHSTSAAAQRSWRRRSACATILVLLAGAARPAKAWDPTTTHLYLLESGLRKSQVHVQWMRSSQETLGIFSPLTLDPAQLDGNVLRALQLAIANAPEGSGARPLGGPGACPGASAPVETQRHCVEGDAWQLSALGWLRLGMLAEATPSQRILHHFISLDEPTALTWRAEVPKKRMRRIFARRNGEPFAGIWTQTNFSGESPSALAWFDDTNDTWSPSHLRQLLRTASLASLPSERERAFILGLLHVGALLHVIQDISVPAHARGDVQAFFDALSARTNDRGLVLQEWVRMHRTRAFILSGKSDTWQEHIGDIEINHPRDFYDAPSKRSANAERLSLAHFVASHFFSSGALPEPVFVAPNRSATEAAKDVIGERHFLAQDEIEGATLSGWPARQGYLLSAGGRPLAAYDHDEAGRTRLFLDEAVYADHAAYLLPLAAEASARVLDRVWPAWPQGSRPSTLKLAANLGAAKLFVVAQDRSGIRKVLSSVILPADQEVNLPAAPVDTAELTHFFVIVGDDANALAYAIERRATAPLVAASPANEDVAASPPIATPSADGASVDAADSGSAESNAATSDGSF